MKYLLTSAGIKNTSIHNVLIDLLGKPIAEASALCIPTAVYAIPGGAGHAWRFFSSYGKSNAVFAPPPTARGKYSSRVCRRALDHVRVPSHLPPVTKQPTPGPAPPHQPRSF